MANEMKINYYDYFYYKLISISKKKYGEEKIWHRLCIILVISFFEAMPLFLFIEIFFRLQSIKTPLVLFQLGLPSSLYIINGIYFLKNKRWETIIVKFKENDQDISRIMVIITAIIIAVSFLCHLYWKVFIDWKVFSLID